MHTSRKIWSISTGKYQYPIEVFGTRVFSYTFGSKTFDHIPTRDDVRNWLLKEESTK